MAKKGNYCGDAVVSIRKLLNPRVATTSAHGAVVTAESCLVEKNMRIIREKVQKATDAFGLRHFLLDNF